jgi:hypothetical protein
MKSWAITAAIVAVTIGSLSAQHAGHSLPAAQADQKTFGAGVTMKDAVPVADLYATPEKYVGKTIRVDGVVTDVCTEMGCWMAIAADGDKDLVVRLKVDHDKGIVFPISARGKKVSAEGVFERIGADDKEGQEAASEQKAGTAKADAFGKQFQLKGLGAVIS